MGDVGHSTSCCTAPNIAQYRYSAKDEGLKGHLICWRSIGHARVVEAGSTTWGTSALWLYTALNKASMDLRDGSGLVRSSIGQDTIFHDMQ
jgi:hypothetical protein